MEIKSILIGATVVGVIGYFIWKNKASAATADTGQGDWSGGGGGGGIYPNGVPMPPVLIDPVTGAKSSAPIVVNLPNAPTRSQQQAILAAVPRGSGSFVNIKTPQSKPTSFKVPVVNNAEQAPTAPVSESAGGFDGADMFMNGGGEATYMCG